MSLRTDLWQRGRDHLELGVTWSCPLRQSQQMPTLFASSEKNVQWIKVVTNDSIATCSSALYIFPFWNFRHRLVRLYWYQHIFKSKKHDVHVWISSHLYSNYPKIKTTKHQKMESCNTWEFIPFPRFHERLHIQKSPHLRVERQPSAPGMVTVAMLAHQTFTKARDTVDGQNPAPPRMMFIR